MGQIITVTRVCRYSVISSKPTPYEFIVVNGQLSYDFCILQSRLATVLRWDGLNYSHLRQVFSWCRMQKLIGQCFKEIFRE